MSLDAKVACSQSSVFWKIRMQRTCLATLRFLDDKLGKTILVLFLGKCGVMVISVWQFVCLQLITVETFNALIWLVCQ